MSSFIDFFLEHVTCSTGLGLQQTFLFSSLLVVFGNAWKRRLPGIGGGKQAEKQAGLEKSANTFHCRIPAGKGKSQCRRSLTSFWST